MATVTSIETLKKERASLRRFFTRKVHNLEDILKTDPVDLEGVEVGVELLSTKVERLFVVDELIVQALLNISSTEDSVIDEEYEAAENYRLKWYIMNKNVEKLKRFDDHPRSVSNTTLRTCRGQSDSDDDHSIKLNKKSVKRNFKLPKIELQKFDGNVRNWLRFWGQFHKIDEDRSIDNHDKFQYLLQATEKGTSARVLVESFPPSGDNYHKAIQHLKDRFAREELLIEVYVRELLSLVLTQAKGELHDQPLSVLYDKLTTQLRALESMDVTSDKYAAMLYPMVESALPEETLIAFERNNLDTTKDKGNQLSNLLQFLKKEVESNQRITMARSNFSENNIEHNNNSSNKPKLSTASALVSTEINKKAEKLCVWCDKPYHCSTECYKAINMVLEERKNILLKKKACTMCLGIGHNAKRCKKFIKCIVCSRRHNVLMCPGIEKPKEGGHWSKDVDKKPDPEPQPSTSLSSSNRVNVTLLQTLLVQIVHGDEKLTVRALIDNGAQRSYILRDVAEKLKLPIVGQQSLSHQVFSGLQTEKRTHNIYNVHVKNPNDLFMISMIVLDEPKICGYLPRVNELDIRQDLDKHNIILTDIGEKPSDISLLIGADYSGCIMTGTIIHCKNGLVALNTRLGWTLQGPTSGVYNATTMLNCLTDLDISDLWRMETIGINDSPYESSDFDVLKLFEENIKVNMEGRYEVALPWKDSHSELHTNYELAEKRLFSTTKRLVSMGNYDSYNKVFDEWLEMGIIEKVTEDDRKGHYLAHHAVVKESSLTTRIRPVFDASAKDRNGNSINACLEKGMNFLELIPKLLIQFRMYAIGITSDIRKAFLQISLIENDRQFLKFLWWRDKDRKEIIIYKHCRVVFGLTSSPFLLAATINHHLGSSPPNLKQTADKLKKSFYVDNCVISLETEEETNRFISESKELMSSAHFDLRGWITGPTKHEKSEHEIISVLGMMWNTVTDDMYCNFNNFVTDINKCTKRKLLSMAQRIFDPIGMTCPTTLIPKLILQKTWTLNYNWDDELPIEISTEFRTWLKTILDLKQFQIPRRLSNQQMIKCERTLHVFCDASKSSYATCIFLRTEYDGNITVRLVMAKARVAPSKQRITIPRLELLAALIGTRLCEQVKTAMELKCRVFYWTDSSVVLTWITKKATWSVFVQNRVNEIRKYTNLNDWYHIPGSLNPADLPSRGCDAKTLIESSWWKGPLWLRSEESTWPSTGFENTVSADEELRRTVSNLVAPTRNFFSDCLLYFSKYTKIVRTVAWIRRFCQNCRNKSDQMRNTQLSYDEYDSAEKFLMKLIQSEYFNVNEMNIWKKIKVFVDSEGLIRVKTKLTLSDEGDDFKFPIVLPNKNIIVYRLVQHEHIALKHSGVQTLMTSLRERFWIIGVRKISKRVIAQCVTCRRYKVKPATTTFAPLPRNRINRFTNVFEICGVDLAGPLYLKSGEKCYIVLFTCAVFRAIHLELTNDLSTETFLMALRRFIARRGRVSTMYSDNGTNFVGFNNLLKSLDWNQITSECTIRKINWLFNPPAAPWWGGWFERLVRLVKELLCRILGKTTVTYVELETILCDCEAVINNRPLTYVTESDDLVPLTPNSFLHSKPLNRVDDLDEIDANSSNIRLRYVQKLREQLRQRFRNEYLALLVHKGKEGSYTLKVGDVVLVEMETKRVNWPLGVVLEIIAGVDSVPRVARVKTLDSIKLRPIQRLYPLEIQGQNEAKSLQKEKVIRPLPKQKSLQDQEDVTQRKVKVTTRSGRLTKPPVRLNL